MLLVSSPSNFFALRRLVILLQKRRFGKKYENKQSNASDIYNEIVHYSFPFINYFQGIYFDFSKLSQATEINFPAAARKIS